MSEFSESYHLRSERTEDACELLRQAGLAGYVYPPVRGWVTFVSEDSHFKPDTRVTTAARLPLLHYVSAEDHGWSFAFFDAAHMVSAYRCEWDNDIRFNDSHYSRAEILRLVPGTDAEALADLEEILRPTDFRALFASKPSKFFAAAMGLEHYEWLAYRSMERGMREAPGHFPDVITVPRNT